MNTTHMSKGAFFQQLPYDVREIIYKEILADILPHGNLDAVRGIARSCKQGEQEIAELAPPILNEFLRSVLTAFRRNFHLDFEIEKISPGCTFAQLCTITIILNYNWPSEIQEIVGNLSHRLRQSSFHEATLILRPQKVKRLPMEASSLRRYLEHQIFDLEEVWDSRPLALGFKGYKVIWDLCAPSFSRVVSKFISQEERNMFKEMKAEFFLLLPSPSPPRRKSWRNIIIDGWNPIIGLSTIPYHVLENVGATGELVKVKDGCEKLDAWFNSFSRYPLERRCHRYRWLYD